MTFPTTIAAEHDDAANIFLCARHALSQALKLYSGYHEASKRPVRLEPEHDRDKSDGAFGGAQAVAPTTWALAAVPCPDSTIVDTRLVPRRGRTPVRTCRASAEPGGCWWPVLSRPKAAHMGPPDWECGSRKATASGELRLALMPPAPRRGA